MAYRYKVNYVPASTFWISHCAAKRPNSILLDLKRMNDLEIDEENMYAVVGPGVIYSQLQEEAMKRGLYTTVPGGGAQVSVLANHINWAFRQKPSDTLAARSGLPDIELVEGAPAETGGDE